ncbi:cobyrinic acid a,c-diamide synthase [Salinigranum rubrum]|uniref:Cobyrinic acid a,c-diamide synthase n=1 Tax=Salinigranum rubrum TaxID=755307 RepID=A0A2I8VFN3_9EURY|nr:cobyrinic acid a,c-diamide synthase [Salinigranum rubrum]AUV80725.1 cobyrinic acid a,c-diamide synthase [Salinigranum rubrum]
MKGVVVAGTASGVGKTVATLALCRALQRLGHEVQPAKAGPDFIDPSHHSVVCGRPSRTLDPWLQGRDGMRRNYARGEGDVCVVEGMMGLYDGDTSTAAVAAGLDLPVLLVVDASAGMESVAATALGFRAYARESPHDVDVVGVVAARAHGGRHEAGIRDALPDGLAYLGRTPPRDDLTIPERHLGLHLGPEAPLPDEALGTAADCLAVDRVLDAAREPSWLSNEAATPDGPADVTDPTDATVAVARDDAFCFVYPATLERLGERATVVTFSPVADDTLPPCDGVYLPGGYPERFAADLDSGGTLDQIADAAADGVPVWGECGGLMALSETLTVDGIGHRMAGVLPARVRMTDGLAALDHVELVAERETLTARRDETRRGHEFHHSTADVASDARFAFDVARGRGIDGHDGLVAYETLGTYAHLHAESGAVDRFLDAVTSD